MNPQEYLDKNFTKIRLIHETKTSEIWLMIANSINFVCIAKIIERTDLPYIQLQRLKHRNLPKIYYAAEYDETTYVLEEFLQGMTLDNYIRVHGKFDESTVKNFALGLCDCLKLLHNKKIIHRDIKPKNLFLTNDCVIKLIDFDAGRLEKSAQIHDTEILGTEGYAAPEQYGFQQTDCRTDIYALGMTLKEILIEPHSNFMSKVIEKCIAFDPLQRFQNTSELLNALENNFFNRLKLF